jgi:hypothetical protein
MEGVNLCYCICIDDFQQFCYSCPPKDRCPEEVQADEAVDCQVIELLRDEVLPHSHAIPREFVLKVVVLLNKGSIHSASNSTNGGKFCIIFKRCHSNCCHIAGSLVFFRCPYIIKLQWFRR